MTYSNGTTLGINVNGIHKQEAKSDNSKTRAVIALENQYSASNYHPLPVVFEQASGCSVTDVDGKVYIDCLSAYSATNQGHCHPKIVAALTEQASRLTLSSRAFHSEVYGRYAKKITELLGFEAVLPMNTGAEAVETAIKLARRWAYMKKGVPQDKAIVLAATENFHGRTIAIISMSTDPEARKNFGPYLERVGPICPHASADNSRPRSIRFNNLPDLEAALDAHGPEVAAFLVESIQGEAGIIIPDYDYLEKAHALCKKHNVLLICDEVQAGLGRTGKMLCFQHNPNVKPDIVTLGKALSGGVYPVSAVLSSREIIDCITPGSHGSTYGANPLGCACAIAALDVLVDENMCERSTEMGERFRSGLRQLQSKSDGWVTEVRGLGLMNAVVINEKKSTKGRGAWHLCLLMMERGVLAKPTHVNTIRLAPPLVITEQEVDQVISVIGAALRELDTREHIEDLSAHDTKEQFVSL